MKRIVAGIVAPVDSGKTTLTEAILYTAGQLREPGRVDRGNAFLDTDGLEKSRGITIFSKQALVRYSETEIALLDTPGHIDFAAETERALVALDCAVLLVTADDGVRGHTLTLWKLLEKHKIPTFIFVNKIDSAARDKADIIQDLKARLSQSCFELSLPQQVRDEGLALLSEGIMDEYLSSGSVSNSTVSAAFNSRTLFPCFFGSALKISGVSDLVDAVAALSRSPGSPSSPLSGVVYKISSDEHGARLTHIKINSGTLRVRDTLEARRARNANRGTINDTSQNPAEKITALRLYSGGRFTPIDEAFPGTTVAALGLTATYPGQGVGDAPDAPLPSIEPVMSFRILLDGKTDVHDALEKLLVLSDEDPMLRVGIIEETGELTSDIMGEFQLEILKSQALSRFGLDISFSDGFVSYRETIAGPTEGVGHFEPLRHYAEVHLFLEPLPRNSGLIFENTCREEMLSKNWQNLIMSHLREKKHIGVLCGFPLTDTKITLISGRGHLKHTEGGDFREATLRAVRQGLRTAGTLLLEPYYNFFLEIPSDAVGRALFDLERMDAVFDAPVPTNNGLTVIEGSAPVAKMARYSADVNRYTKGLGRLSCSFKGYEECKNTGEIVAATAYDCDADTTNTADSIFCVRGAGHIVRWDQAPKHMHVSNLKPSTKDNTAQNDQNTARVSPLLSSTYRGSLVEDKELLKIFEKTYGPVKRDVRTAFVKQTDPAVVAAVPKSRGEEYLLVDGYNMIFAWDTLKALASEDLDAARSLLINRLANYQGYCKCEVIVVFDAYKVSGGTGETERHGNVSVVYTKEAETADMYIEKAARRLVKEKRVRVATSDVLEQLIIISAGAGRISADMFLHELELVEAEIRKIMDVL